MQIVDRVKPHQLTRMKTQILLIAFSVAILTTCAKAQSQPGLPSLPIPWPQFPYPQPNLPNPMPTPTPPQPNLPNPTPPAPQQGQVPGIVDGCSEALREGRIVSCILDIVNSSLSHQIYLSPGCCSLLTTCRPSLPAQQNPFFEFFIHQYCH